MVCLNIYEILLITINYFKDDINTLYKVLESVTEA